jgi:hypothetical protein
LLLSLREGTSEIIRQKWRNRMFLTQTLCIEMREGGEGHYIWVENVNSLVNSLNLLRLFLCGSAEPSLSFFIILYACFSSHS